MEDAVDVKALRARFNNAISISDASSRDSGSPKSPRPGFGRAVLPPSDNNAAAHHSPSPVFSPPAIGPGLLRFPRAEPTPSFAQPPPAPGVRSSVQPPDVSKVKQKGEILESMMLRHQRPPGAKPAQVLPLAPAEGPAHSPAPPAPRQLPRQRRAGEVVPLRRHLPPEGPLPLKPKRPPSVNLGPYTRFNRGAALPAPRKSQSRKMSLPVSRPAPPPQRASKPDRLPHQFASVDIEDDQDTYDDIGSFEKNESGSDGSHCMDGDDDETYEFIDGEQPEVNAAANKKEAKKQQEREKREQMERQKKENDLWKKFKLQGQTEVLHTAKVRQDWQGGGKLDLSVRQGDSVDILRVKNNPGGKWLARSLTGSYGYISNTCVDIDYEEVKRKVLQSKKIDLSPLPPPPPDPRQMVNVESGNRDSLSQDEDDYDDVQPISNDFPPPPPEISIDPKTEKELRKKFKYEGPIRVLHTMMVDPNSIIKKPRGRDLHVSHGDVLDVIQLTSNKKALCRNAFGKFGHVSRSLLLPLEGDIYDDVDYPSDVYDNDSPQ